MILNMILSMKVADVMILNMKAVVKLFQVRNKLLKVITCNQKKAQ